MERKVGKYTVTLDDDVWEQLQSTAAPATAYDEAARKLHGEFARLNFPEEKAS